MNNFIFSGALTCCKAQSHYSISSLWANLMLLWEVETIATSAKRLKPEHKLSEEHSELRGKWKNRRKVVI